MTLHMLNGAGMPLPSAIPMLGPDRLLRFAVDPRNPNMIADTLGRLTDLVDRSAAEAAIERLIALLDWRDGDADFEPALGWPTDRGIDALHSSAFAIDAAGAGGELEPSLGWLEKSGRGAPTAEPFGCEDHELEDENDEESDHREDCGDEEPALGWCEKESQGLKIGIDTPISSIEPDETIGSLEALVFDGSGVERAHALLREIEFATKAKVSGKFATSGRVLCERQPAPGSDVDFVRLIKA